MLHKRRAEDLLAAHLLALTRHTKSRGPKAPHLRAQNDS